MNDQDFTKYRQMMRELKFAVQSLERGKYDQAERIIQRSNLTNYEHYEQEEQGVLYWVLGMLHDHHQELTDAERYLLQSIEKLQSGSDQEALIRAMIALSKVVSKKGDIEQALQLLKQAYKIAIYERISNLLEITLLFQLGIMHGKLGELYSSIHYLTEALQLNQLIKTQYHVGQIYMSLGICYMQLDRFQESKNAFKKAAHAFQLDDDQENLAGIYMNLGILYSYNQVYDETYRYLKLAIDLYQQQQELELKYKCMIKLAQTYYYDGEFETASMYCKGILAENKLKPSNQIKVYELLSDIALLRKDLATSVEYIDQAMALITEEHAEKKEHLFIKKAKLLYQMGELKQAAALFKDSL